MKWKKIIKPRLPGEWDVVRNENEDFAYRLDGDYVVLSDKVKIERKAFARILRQTANCIEANNIITVAEALDTMIRATKAHFASKGIAVSDEDIRAAVQHFFLKDGIDL